jgi:ABC-type transport system substrate-binding protein
MPVVPDRDLHRAKAYPGGRGRSQREAPFNQAPIGTGAFKWGQRVAGDHLELVANTEYFGDGPYIEQLIFKYIPDLTVLYTQFKSGDIDLVGQLWISPDTMPRPARWLSGGNVVVHQELG